MPQTGATSLRPAHSPSEQGGAERAGGGVCSHAPTLASELRSAREMESGPANPRLGSERLQQQGCSGGKVK